MNKTICKTCGVYEVLHTCNPARLACSAEIEAITVRIGKICRDIEFHGWTPDRDDELGRLTNDRELARMRARGVRLPNAEPL